MFEKYAIDNSIRRANILLIVRTCSFLGTTLCIRIDLTELVYLAVLV